MTFLSASATFSASIRRALPLIQAGVSRGLSSTALQRSLSRTGFGVRRTDLLDAMRSIRGEERAGSALRSIRRDRKPDPLRLPIAKTSIRRNFSFDVKVTGFDSNTGERFDRFITIATDDLMTRQEIEDKATEVIEDDQENYPMDIDTIVIQRGRRRA